MRWAADVLGSFSMRFLCAEEGADIPYSANRVALGDCCQILDHTVLRELWYLSRFPNFPPCDMCDNVTYVTCVTPLLVT